MSVPRELLSAARTAPFGFFGTVRRPGGSNVELLDPAAAKFAAPTRAFVAAYGARKAGDDDYVTLLRGALPALKNLKQQGDPTAFGRLASAQSRAVENRDPTPLQGAHRAVLLHLQAVADGPGHL